MTYEYPDTTIEALRGRFRESDRWRNAFPHGEFPAWLFHLLATVLTLTDEAGIEYLTTDYAEQRGTVVAVTPGLIVKVTFTVGEDDALSVVDAAAIPRSAIARLTLLDLPMSDPESGPYKVRPADGRFRIDFSGDFESLEFPVANDSPGDSSHRFTKAVLESLSSR